MTKTKKVWLSVLSLLMTVCLISGSTPVSTLYAKAEETGVQQPTDPGDGTFFIPTGDADPLLEKTATPVPGMDGYYDITLTLKPPKTTQVTTTKKTDIVLVIDKSASMTNGNNILSNVKTAANGLVDNVLTDSLKDAVRVAVVGFSGPTSTNANATESNSLTYWGFSNSASTVKGHINDIRSSGGTNTEAGLKKAYDLLSTSTAEQKFVVFLSDGGPTFRLTSVAENVGRGNYVYYGTGTNDDSGFNATCALAWADALKAPVGQTVSRSVTGDNNRTVNIVQNQAGLGAKVFSVGYGVDTSDYASPDTEDVQYYFSANQASQIANIFKLIQQTIVDSMAASNVVVRDIVTDDFDIVTPAGEVAVDGQDIPSGQSVTINGRTVTGPLGAITSSETDRLITITFRIKLREDRFLEAGTYVVPTNTNAQVTYRQNDADLHQVFEVPSVTIQVDADRYGMSKTAAVTDWDARTYDITVKAWSAVPPQTMWVDRTDYVADGSVTPSADNEGESHLVYIGSGDNDPVSQDPADYALRKVSSETTGEITDSYWAYDDPETGLVRYTGEIHWRRGFLDYPVADNPDPNSGTTYYGRTGTFLFIFPIYSQLTWKQDATYTTAYFWEDQEDAGAAERTVYKTVTTQVPVTPEGNTPLNAATQVVDVVDDRFEIVSTSPAGAAVEGNKVTWTLDALTGTAAKPGFTGTITVRAKADYVGGNNVATNVEAQSGLIIGDNTLRPFPDQPTVNVKAQLSIGDTERTIFLGEAVPTDTSVLEDMGASADGLTYTWTDGPGVAEGQLPAGYVPGGADPLVYTLTASLAMEAPTDKSLANTAGQYNANPVTDTGLYTVNILTGSLTIRKTLSDKSDADTSTAFVFRVDRFDEEDRLVETFYRTVFTGDDKTGSITVTGLPKGRYEITEQTGWSWRYDLIDKNQDAQTLGCADGYTDDAITAVFINEKKNDKWAGATDSVVNVFEGGTV